MTFIDELLASYKKSIEMMRKQIELMEDKKLQIHSVEPNGTRTDTSPFWIKEYKRRIDDLDEIIALHNKH
jgi:hypothetical protein